MSFSNYPSPVHVSTATSPLPSGIHHSYLSCLFLSLQSFRIGTFTSASLPSVASLYFLTRINYQHNKMLIFRYSDIHFISLISLPSFGMPSCIGTSFSISYLFGSPSPRCPSPVTSQPRPPHVLLSASLRQGSGVCYYRSL